MQKHNKGMGQDLENSHPKSMFMPEDKVKLMEEWVEIVWPQSTAYDNPSEDEDGYEGSMKVPCSALDGCEASFTATDERQGKAGTQFFDCKALMALLCQHDQVLWIA
ncbi:hypothetical protein PM082_009568 [Marasmius tenuissimus]|nr:hypothetical protein PM082_009568 [Marasmius tenuissimus]